MIPSVAIISVSAGRCGRGLMGLVEEGVLVCGVGVTSS